MMRSGRSRNLDTVWRNKDEAVETNGTSYAGNAIMCPDSSAVSYTHLDVYKRQD